MKSFYMNSACLRLYTIFVVILDIGWEPQTQFLREFGDGLMAYHSHIKNLKMENQITMTAR